MYRKIKVCLYVYYAHFYETLLMHLFVLKDILLFTATCLGKPKDACKCKGTAYQEKDTYDLMDRCLCDPLLSNSKLECQKGMV